MKRHQSIAISFAGFVLLASGSTASAHALGAECTIQGERVVVEAFFSDNTSAQDAVVTIYNNGKRAIARGTTDADGRWSFPVPPAGRYDVVVEAGMGHRAEVSFIVNPDSRSAPESTRVASQGPTRSEFTRLPWERVLCGLSVIALGAIVLRWRLRKKSPNLHRGSQAESPSISTPNATNLPT